MIDNTEGFIDLEPDVSNDLDPKSSNTQINEAKIEQRKEDVKLLSEALPNLRFNQLTNKIEYGSRTSPQVMAGDDLEQLTVKLAVEDNVYIPEHRVKQAVKCAAKSNSYCPIRRYLMECCYKNEEFEHWDNLGKYLIGSDKPIATIAMQRFLVGAVARAYKPGCTMSWMPIFVGVQGCGKSQLLRSLVPEDLFSEVTVAIDLLQKEMYRLHIAWLIELPEVDAYFSVRHIENFKNLITTRVDETRMPYQQLPVSLARRFVVAGTSNRSEIFVDPSGNRRFIPMEIANGFETPWKELINVRDALWARAVREYEAGAQWEITSGEIAEMSDYIQQFSVVDPWDEMVSKYLENREEVTSSEVLINALSFPAQSLGSRETRRISAVLTSMGWRRLSTTRKMADGKRKSVRIWQRPIPLEHKPEKLNDF